MSPTAPRKTRPATKKTSGNKTPARTVHKAAKSAAKVGASAKSTSAKKAPASKKSSSTTVKATRKRVGKVAPAKKSAVKSVAAGKSAASQAIAKKSTATRGTIAKKSAVVAAKPVIVAQRSKVAVVKVATKPTATQREVPKRRAVSPALAKRHFLEVLEAKQERVRQGPNYPAANAFTGRIDAGFSGSVPEIETALPINSSTPSPDAVYGETFDHPRGNQRKRKQG